MTALDQFYPDSPHWARSTPAGWARWATQGRWIPTLHLMVVQRYLMALEAGQIENLIITMPPRHGKTEFVTKAFPGYFLGKHPHEEVIITCYESTLASDFGGVVRDQMQEFGRDIFGLGVKSNKRASGNWRLTGFDINGVRATGGLRATGVGGGLSGRGGGLIIIDDPIKDAMQAQSEVFRKKLWDWYLSTLYTRKSPTAKQLVVTTRWHEDDLVGRLLEDKDGDTEGQKWTVLNLPAICDVENDVLGRKIGEALWPERWTLDRLTEIKGTMTPYWWGALYQGRPSPASGNMFKRKWWNFWMPSGTNLGPVRSRAGDEAEIVKRPIELPTMEMTISSWDLAFKKGKGTSFVAGQKWGKNGGNVFLLDQTRERRDFPETIAAFRAFHDLHKDITGKWVEDKANGPALIAFLKDEISGILPIEPKGSKEDRARAVAFFPESGNVYLPHPIIAPWVWEFIEEHAAFPNSMTNDQVDTFSQAMMKLFVSEELPSMLWGRRHAARRR